MNPQVWVASGHVGGFSDPLMDCRECKTRHRADKLIEEVGGDANAMTFEQMADYIREHKVACPACGSTNFTDIRKFNLMFKTFQGVTEDAKNEIFCAQKQHKAFCKLCQYSAYYVVKLPFEVATNRKNLSRNEITPRQLCFPYS